MTAKKDNKDAVQLPEGCTPEILASFKEKHGEKLVKVQQCESQEGLHDPFTIVTRVPDRRCMEMYQKFIDRDPSKANDILVNQCVLHGKEMVKACDYMTLSAVSAISELIPTSKTVTKNA